MTKTVIISLVVSTIVVISAIIIHDKSLEKQGRLAPKAKK